MKYPWRWILMSCIFKTTAWKCCKMLIVDQNYYCNPMWCQTEFLHIMATILSTPSNLQDPIYSTRTLDMWDGWYLSKQWRWKMKSGLTVSWFLTLPLMFGTVHLPSPFKTSRINVCSSNSSCCLLSHSWNNNLLLSTSSALLEWSSSTFDRSVTDSTLQFFRCKDEKYKIRKLGISD